VLGLVVALIGMYVGLGLVRRRHRRNLPDDRRSRAPTHDPQRVSAPKRRS
jgi:hypothetical protein